MSDTLEDAGLAAAFEAAMNGTSTVDTTTVEAPVAEPTTVEAPVTETQSEAKQQDTFNYAEWLSEKTEGFIKDEESLKTILPKAKGYDDLETKLKDLETKVPKFNNPESEALYKAWANGDKDAVVNYIKETTKDYKTMSDLDVVREALSKKNPGWSPQEVELEIRAEYGKQLQAIDLDSIEKEDELGRISQEYKDAVAHNERVEENQLRLSRAARDNRSFLLEQQSKIELPKISQAEAPQATSQQPTAEELAERQSAWEKNVLDNLPKLSNLKMNIDDKEVEYVRSDAEKKELTDYMKSFNIFTFAKEQGWTNEDGTPNPLKIAEDVQKLKKFDTIVKSFSSQVKTDVTKETLKKIKNVDNSLRSTTPDGEPQSLEEAYARARGWE